MLPQRLAKTHEINSNSVLRSSKPCRFKIWMAEEIQNLYYLVESWIAKPIDKWNKDRVSLKIVKKEGAEKPFEHSLWR